MAGTSAPAVRRHGRALRKDLYLGRIAVYVLLMAAGVAFLFPFYTMFVGSFMVREQLFSFTPNLWPNPFILTNYVDLFNTMPFHRYLGNSILLATGQTAGVLFFCSLVGFTMAKRRFPGRDLLFLILLITMMIPRQATLIPWYLLMAKLGWLNTFLPMWVPWWAPAWGGVLDAAVHRLHRPRRAHRGGDGGRGLTLWHLLAGGSANRHAGPDHPGCDQLLPRVERLPILAAGLR